MWRVCIHVYKYVHICTHWNRGAYSPSTVENVIVCMYACMYVCVCVGMHVRTWRVCIYTYICTHTCVYVYTHTYMHTCTYTNRGGVSVRAIFTLYFRVRQCLYACTCVCACIHTYLQVILGRRTALAYFHTLVHSHIHTYTHIYIHVYSPIGGGTPTPTDYHVVVLEYACVYILYSFMWKECIHTYMHSDTRVHVQDTHLHDINTYIHTYIQVYWGRGSPTDHHFVVLQAGMDSKDFDENLPVAPWCWRYVPLRCISYPLQHVIYGTSHYDTLSIRYVPLRYVNHPLQYVIYGT